MYQFYKCRPIKRDQKKQEVKEVKRVDKNAQDIVWEDTTIGRIRRKERESEQEKT